MADRATRGATGEDVGGRVQRLPWSACGVGAWT